MPAILSSSQTEIKSKRFPIIRLWLSTCCKLWEKAPIERRANSTMQVLEKERYSQQDGGLHVCKLRRVVATGNCTHTRPYTWKVSLRAPFKGLIISLCIAVATKWRRRMNKNKSISSKIILWRDLFWSLNGGFLISQGKWAMSAFAFKIQQYTPRGLIREISLM